ncbi:MAG: regulatory signaling modulator protein AmpE [Pseudomonadota bacterium]|nr:regulatory signaling modulator protein AmpE [Pseudomonadota bacterium]
MNFLVLILGLSLERLLTNFYHLRGFNWLNPLFDIIFSKLRVAQSNLAILSTILIVAALILPLWLLEFSLEGDLAYIPQFIFSMFVFIFCLGPSDLDDNVTDFSDAVSTGDSYKANKVASELLEHDTSDEEILEIDKAIYAQANNRIFGVVFWFVLIGPLGAWLFRLLDLMQRRAVHFSKAIPLTDSRYNPDRLNIIAAPILLHRMIAWAPGHLLACSYVLAGSFDGAVTAWRNFTKHDSTFFPGPTDQLLGVLGCSSRSLNKQNDPVAKANIALEHVERTLWFIWCPILALMTLYNLLS